MSSNSKKLNKQTQLNKRKKEVERKKKLNKLAIIMGIIVVLAAIVFVIVENNKPLPGEEVDVMKDQSHIPDINSSHIPYNTDPPTSGQHVEYIANWGVHKEPVPKEVLVHNLEDGGVVIYYNNNTDQETISQLEQLIEGYKDHVILTPYAEMEDNITLTAWGRIDRLSQFDENRINTFIQAFKGKDHH